MIYIFLDHVLGNALIACASADALMRRITLTCMRAIANVYLNCG